MQSYKLENVLSVQNGLYGTVKKVDEEKVDVEIAKGVVITVSRFAISEVL